MIEFYIIKHKPTGKVIPTVGSNEFKKKTHVEPEKPSDNIRLFRTKRAAKSFLTIWLKGKVEVESDYNFHTHTHTTPVPTRKLEEMEITTAKLKLKGTKK